MTTVAAYHIGHIAVYPFLEIGVCALILRRTGIPALHPFALGKFPLVAGLVHHKQTHLVAQVIDLRSMGIVAHADGIDADGLQFQQTTAPYLGRHGSTEHTGIVVNADALNLHPLTVEGKTLVGREIESAQACMNNGCVAPSL